MTLTLRSHPRSGTNMLRSALNIALTGSDSQAPALTGHWTKRITVEAPTGYNPSHNFYSGEMGVIYTYRDGRDVLASLYRSKSFLNPSWVELTFTEFLQRPLDWLGSPGKSNTRGTLTAIEHWREHLDSWHRKEGVLYIRYEDMLTGIQGQIDKIAEHFKLRVVKEVKEVKSTGPFPSGDYRLEKWREVFSERDLELFFEIVPVDHWGLFNG